jgi:hypothetical protein
MTKLKKKKLEKNQVSENKNGILTSENENWERNVVRSYIGTYNHRYHHTHNT